MKIGSLFSGIGGLELGLERAGIGSTVWQVEQDAWCRRVLAKHWPEAKRYEDVRTVGAELGPVDLICGGFPCQDVSSAGKRVGLAGARSGLWFEYLRIVSELMPEWVVVENVAGGAKAWVDTCVSGLEQQGYACLPIPLSAADVGAPHLRRRVFIVAHLDRDREHALPEHAEMGIAPALTAHLQREQLRVESGRRRRSDGSGAPEPTLVGWSGTQPGMVRMVHGVSPGLDRRRVKALGNAVVSQCAEVVGHIIKELAQ